MGLEEAEQKFKKSIELNPNYAAAHHWYAELLTIQGRHEEAKTEMRRALEINPLSHNYLADLAQIYYHNREYDKAKEYCLKALEIYPDFNFANLYLHYIYLKTGEYDKAIELHIKHQQLLINLSNPSDARRKRSEDFGNYHRELYREGGIEEYMRKTIEEMHPGEFYVSAMRYAFLGEKEKALDNLEKTLEQRQVFLFVFVKADPIFDNLRDEPRYQEPRHFCARY